MSGAVIGLLSVVVLVACVGKEGSASSAEDTSMAISEHSSYDGQVLVGHIYTTDIDIKNVGKVDIPALQIMFDSGDKFLDHNVVVKSGPCTVDKSLPGLECGKLAVGIDLMFALAYQPKDPGNFKFVFHIANGGRYLGEADGSKYNYSWTQAILA